MFRILCIVFCMILSMPVRAAPYEATYDVYAGGIHAMQAKLTLAQTAKKYDILLKVETYGLLKKLADWRGSFGSKGNRLSPSNHKPHNHFSEAIWKGEREQKTYVYNQAGNLVSYKVIEAGKDETPKDIDPALFKNTTDILSATLDVMDDLRVNEKCNKTRTIFDGDRNFDVIFKSIGTEDLKQTKYNIYAGKTILCTIEVKPNAGKWHEKPRGWISIQEQGRKAGTMPTIWFAPLASDPKAPYIPVKLRVKTDYGTLFMHLTSFKDNKKKVTP